MDSRRRFPFDLNGHVVNVNAAELIPGLNFGNVLNLPDGDDVVFAADAADIVYGDNRVLNADPPVVNVGTRQDTLYGEDGEDDLFGQDRDDFLSGGADADDIDGGEDIDWDDMDRVFQEVDAEQVVLTNTLLTGQGPDTLTGIELATLVGGSSDNVIDASAFDQGPVILIGFGPRRHADRHAIRG